MLCAMKALERARQMHVLAATLRNLDGDIAAQRVARALVEQGRAGLGLRKSLSLPPEP